MTNSRIETQARLDFLRRGTETIRAEWESLRRESDAELYFEGLLRLGQSLEAKGHLPYAAQVYASIVDATAGGADLERLHFRAEQALNVLSGGVTFGARSEFLLRRLAQGASDPATILAMGAGGALFRMTRLATLARLSAVPTASLLTRGVGARALAGFAGFAVEAPTFVAAGRLGGAMLGRPQDGSAAAWGRDLASSYLSLGALRLVSSVVGANLVFARGQGWGRRTPHLLHPRGASGAPGSPLQVLFQQGSMLTGILFAHRMEEWAGLRSPSPGAVTLADSLAMLLQFNISARLTRHVFGPRMAAWERGLELRTEALASRPSPPFGNGWNAGDFGLGLRPLVVAPGTRGLSPSTEFSGPLFMTGDPQSLSGGGRGEPSLELRDSLHAELRLRIQELRERATAEPVDSVKALRWREEADWLEQAPKGGLTEFFNALLPLRGFYSRNLRLGGRDGLNWLQGLQQRLFAEVRSRDAYSEYLRREDEGQFFLQFPVGMSQPSTLPELALEHPTVIPLRARQDPLQQPLAYYRISDLLTCQEIVSVGKLAEYRLQAQERADFSRAVQVGFHPRFGRWFLLDGHHRTLASLLTGRAYILGTQVRAFAPVSQSRSIAELRQVSRAEYEAIADQNERGAGMSESSMLVGFEGLEGLSQSSGSAPTEGSTAVSWAELLRRMWNRR